MASSFKVVVIFFDYNNTFIFLRKIIIIFRILRMNDKRFRKYWSFSLFCPY